MTLQKLNNIQKSYWDSYIFSLPREMRPLNPTVSASYAGNREITDELLALYIKGTKTAGSSVVEDFVTAGDPLPEIDNYWIFLKSNEEPGCILKTVDIKIHKFKEVPVAIAVAEGEGDLTLEYWCKVHGELYSPFLKSWGLSTIEDATIITEFFSIVYSI